jgi:hypothetical protein
MRYSVSSHQFQTKLSTILSSSEAISEHLRVEGVQLPDDIHKWLGRLKLLHGVPFNYLVPDEGMLPLESIRFFYLDNNWMNALLDGAFSIGRNLTSVEAGSASLQIDKATFEAVRKKAAHSAGKIRSHKLGLGAEVPINTDAVYGFLLRSALVAKYPGIGVNVYPKGRTPADDNPKLLNILRFEVLGPHSDTILCLIESDPEKGEVYQIDLHEPPEHLHFGIDQYEMKNGAGTGIKTLRSFTVNGNEVTIDKNKEVEVEVPFRSGASRTLRMAAMATQISEKAGNGSPVTSAEMGFEMTQGVGRVSFIKQS